MRSSTETLIKAMRILSTDIQSEDGVANAAIAEAAQLLEEQQERIQALNRGNANAERILCELTGCGSGRDVLEWILDAKERIKRLEEAGDEMWKWRDVISAQKWEKAKEAKP